MRPGLLGMYPERAFLKVGGRMTYEGGGKGSSPPPAPDYTGAAQAQAQGSKEATVMQNYANRPDQFTPFGSSTWQSQAATDPSTGLPVTQWNQNIALAPQTQQALDAQMAMQQGRSQLAASTMPRVQADVAQPWNFNQFTPRVGQGLQAPGLDVNAPQQLTQNVTPDMFSADRMRIEQGLFDRMRPEHQFQEEAMRTRLANQGITEGSAAYGREEQQMADLQARERFNALMLGGDEQARMQQNLLRQQQQAFGQDVQSQAAGNVALQNQQAAGITGANFTNQLRQQEIAEEAQRRGMSLNEMNALITGQQVSTPQMPGFVTAQRSDPAQLLAAAQMQDASAIDRYNAQQASRQSTMSGLFSLGGAGIGGYFGGPYGAMLGSSIGGSAGSLFG